MYKLGMQYKVIELNAALPFECLRLPRLRLRFLAFTRKLPFVFTKFVICGGGFNGKSSSDAHAFP
jgi:hypothetical protein